MRVISGSARGRRLKEPEGHHIRPTTDMVKESIFNIVQFDIEGRRILDLFAGTGQLGIEALSRGASAAVFVDESGDAAKLVRDNVKAVGLEDRATIVRSDALSYLRQGGGRFDVIFLDPPYDTTLIEKALKTIFEFDLVKENGIIICETKEDRLLPDVAAPYIKGREYRYGKIKITLYARASMENL
jgi:16S rRNA (guanine(966)-N(2))-methyltransferase RsmD